MNQISLIILIRKHSENLEQITDHLRSCLPIDEVFWVNNSSHSVIAIDGVTLIENLEDGLWDEFIIASLAKNENILLHNENLIVEPKDLEQMWKFVQAETDVNVGIQGRKCLERYNSRFAGGYCEVLLTNCLFTTKKRCSIASSKMKDFDFMFPKAKSQGSGRDILLSFTGPNFSRRSENRQIFKYDQKIDQETKKQNLKTKNKERTKILKWCRKLKNFSVLEKPKDFFLIELKGGLGNRFRTMFYWLNLARKDGRKLKVVWHTYPQCNGSFLESFEVPDNMEIYESPKDNQSEEIANLKKKFRFDFVGSGIEYQNKADFDELVLLPDVEQRKVEFQKRLRGDYVAVHVRRTDKMPIFRKWSTFTSIKKYYNFIDSLDNSLNIFLATDSHKIQARFKKRYGDRVYWVEDLVAPKNFRERQSTLQNAILDLFLSKDSKFFFGDQFSSFTTTINILRKHSDVVI